MLNKFIVIIIVFFLHSPLLAPKETSGMIYYLDKYLKIFTNLTAAEVLTGIDVESSGNPKAIRYEKRIKCYARGALQITDKTARWRGYEGPLEDLCSWKTGLYWGMEYMSYQKRRYAESVRPWQKNIQRRRMFAAYNYGSVKFVKKDGKWEYKNQWHVNKCEKRYKYWTKNLHKKRGESND